MSNANIIRANIVSKKANVPLCRVQRYTIYLTFPNKSRRNIYKKTFKALKHRILDYPCLRFLRLTWLFEIKNFDFNFASASLFNLKTQVSKKYVYKIYTTISTINILLLDYPNTKIIEKICNMPQKNGFSQKNP